jgi:hypothetical protein
MKAIVLVFMAISLTGCYQSGSSAEVNQSNRKDDYQVTFLFEKDGLRIYRFFDGGTGRYFATGKGKFLPQLQKTSNGKSSSSWTDGVETE